MARRPAAPKRLNAANLSGLGADRLGELLMQAALRNLIPVEPGGGATPGEVLLFRMRDGAVAKHLGILAGVGEAASFVHAYDRHGVVESPLSAPWQARIAARFRWPEPR